MRLTHFLKERKGVLGIMVVLVGINIYLYSYLSGLGQNLPKPVIFESKICPKTAHVEVVQKAINQAGNLVASKNGTRFYYIWCTGANRIKAENRRYFDTIDEALKEGYKPASNCPGL